MTSTTPYPNLGVLAVVSIAERYWIRKPQLLRILSRHPASETVHASRGAVALPCPVEGFAGDPPESEIKGTTHASGALDCVFGSCQYTVYLRPDSLASHQSGATGRIPDPWDQRVASVVEQAGESETGLVIFLGAQRTAALVPPFPVPENIAAEKAHTTPLVGLLTNDLLVGVVLVRLGRYAVGVLRDSDLVASKTGSRYVKSRHRAGGSSQRRFERSRERLVRELFDKACEVSQAILSPFSGKIDYVLMGGERHTLRSFVQRCSYLKTLKGITLDRVLQVDRPGQKALEGISGEVWKTRVLTFAGDDTLRQGG